MKSKGWKKKFVSATLLAGLLSASCMPVLAEEQERPKAAALPEVKTIAEIDFGSLESLDSGLGGWKVNKGAGTAELVDDNEKGKVLRLQRNTGGNETSLVKDNLDIREEDYRYVSVETKMKLGTESHANQFSIPYLSDSKDTVAYTLYTDDDWSQYKSHVNGKNDANKLSAGAAVPGKWQTVRMDIDLKEDSYRVSVDGEYLLAGAGARAKVDNLSKIKYYADSWNTGTIYFQSVKITAQVARTQSAVFYVSNSGDDTADGMSEETSWASIDRVNQEPFIPGDKILFQAGGKWENETLQPQGSGDNSAKITIGSYGEGAMPQIAANGKVKDALYLCNQQYWEISGLDISNTVEGFTQITNGGIPTGNVAERDAEQGKKLGEYRGIHIAGRDEASLKGFWIHDVKVHDVTGEVAWIGNTGLKDTGIVNNAGLDGSKRTGGLLIECLQPTGNKPTQFSDIVIEDSQFINNSFCGITVKQWHGSGNQYSANPGWDSRNNGKKNGAPDYADSNWYPHSNILIQDNYINQGASAYACNGIYLTSSKDSVIQNNVLEHIGTCGIELYFADNVAVQFNEVSDVVKKGGGADDNAIDPDWRVTNALIQYNYIHDCGEGLLLCGVEYNSGVIRYNLVQDCGRSYVHYSMGSGYFQIYNNVFYRSADGNGTNNFDPWGGGTASYFNNVFYDGKKTGFTYSGGSSFSYYNNAYYGTAAPSRDSNAILLAEDPFEGTAPSLSRMGSFESGVLLEANGLKPKPVSELASAGSIKDANGISIEDGLKSKGTKFNFTSLAEANKSYFNNCVNIERKDYPAFKKTDAEATLDTNWTQNTASDQTPSIGLFESTIDENAVILKGKVSDGINVLADAAVEVNAGGNVVQTKTNASGLYSILEGLAPGKAVITVKRDGYEDAVSETVLEKGKINIADITVPLLPMPEAYTYTVIDENFDNNSSEDFAFDKGSAYENGQMVITKGMGNAEAAVSYFSAQTANQKGVDFSFNWTCDAANKMGFEFRDSYGRLLFAICAAPGKNELRTSTTGGAVSDAKAAAAEEPAWSAFALDTSKTYTIRVHADFEAKQLSYQVAEKGSSVLTQELNVPTEAVNLAKMNACSWWDSKPQYIDNFKLTAPEAADLPLAGKTVYAFGDSIAAGHQYMQSSFIDFVAAKEDLRLTKLAINGATIMDVGYQGGQILAQIENAPAEGPDFVLFDGGTNDAEYIYKNNIAYGTVGESKEPESFDTATFAGAFEQTVYQIKQKWPDAQLIYTAVHKMGSRDNAVQEALHSLELQICEKWGIALANVYEDAVLDTNDTNQKNNYTFDSNGSNGLPGVNGSGTHPNFAAIEEFYVPVVSAAFRNPEVPGSDAADKEALQQLYEENKDKINDGYTADTWQAFQSALAGAEAVLENPTALQEEADNALAALQSAIENLSKEEPATYDKNMLLALIIVADKDLAQNGFYEEEGLVVLKTAVETARNTADDPDATQEDIDVQSRELQNALDSLITISGKEVNALRDARIKALAETLKTDVYTEDSIQKLQEAIAAAENIMYAQDSEDEAIAEQITALETAVGALEEKEDPVPVEKAALGKLLETANKQAQKTDLYTEESLAALTEAISNAQMVYDDPSAEQDAVDGQLSALQAALDGLAEKQKEPEVNKAELIALIEEAEALSVSEGVYTEDSMAALKKALADAKAVLNKADVTQEEVDTQKNQLQAAIDGLAEKTPEDNKDPDDSKKDENDNGAGEDNHVSGGDNNGAGKNNNGSGSYNKQTAGGKANTNSGQKAPSRVKSIQTGDKTNITIFCMLSVISAMLILGIVLHRRKTK